MRIIKAVFLPILLLWTSLARADEIFSIDPASPLVFSAADVLTRGPTILQGATSLGLIADDNVNSLSFGRDLISRQLFFSVDRVTVGLPGTAVFSQLFGSGSAAPDVFLVGPGFGNNQLAISGPQLGLMPGFLGDDLDALDLSGGGPITYFTIDAFSPTNILAGGNLAKDILLSTGNGSFLVFADGSTAIGLDLLDEIDALILWDVVNPGVLDPGVDQALFSLSPFSPSTFTGSGGLYVPGVPGFLSPGDILYTDFSGEFSLWVPAAALGLRDDDNVNALATIIPEPATTLLLGSGVLLPILWRTARRQRGISLELAQAE